MAKRLTDTEKWRKPWYRKLSTENKILWQYFLDNCDKAGFIKIDCEVLKMDTNIDTNMLKIESDFAGKVYRVSTEYHWVAKFVEFQYSSKFLLSDDRCSKSVRERLNSFGIEFTNENGKINPVIQGASKGLVSPYEGHALGHINININRDININRNIHDKKNEDAKDGPAKQKNRKISKPLSADQISELEKTVGEDFLQGLASKYCKEYVEHEVEAMKTWLLEKLGTKGEKTDVGARQFVKRWLERSWDDWRKRNPEIESEKIKSEWINYINDLRAKADAAK